MSSINSVRIPGLATGMDTEQMIKDMLTGEQSKVDKAEQKNQVSKWQQEQYREIIKDVKELYDKYFTATSKDFILSSKIYSTVVVNSSNNNIISANANAGANIVNYKFKVEEMAKPARLESLKIDKDKTVGAQGLVNGDKTSIKINGKDIEISSDDKISDVVNKINEKFSGGEVKAIYSEMTGKLTIESGKTGISSKLTFSGEFFNNSNMISTTGNSVNSIKLDNTKTLKEQGVFGDITINNQVINIQDGDMVSDLVSKINNLSQTTNVTSTFNQSTGMLNIQSDKELTLSGDTLDKIGIDTKLSRVESKIEVKKDDKLIDIGIQEGKININGTEIDINKEDTVSTLIEKINNSNSKVKCSYDESSKKLKLESKQDLNIVGLDNIIDKKTIKRDTISQNTISGSNNKVSVYDNDGITLLNTITQENNSFTVDNITYSVNGVTTGNELVSMTSTKDATKTLEKVKEFIDDYNKIIDDIYDNVTKKKNKDYKPLTEAQKEEMSEEEIEKWESKAKEGLLRNDKELRLFMDDIKKAIFSPIGDLGITLGDIGIETADDYNKQGQLQLNVDKFTKALEEKGDLVYKATTEGFSRIKDITYKYAGNSTSVFLKKAGLEKTSTEINNLFSEQIRKQEQQIKNITRKMQEKEEALYKKFAMLESNMSKLNSQMSYLMSSMGM